MGQWPPVCKVSGDELSVRDLRRAYEGWLLSGQIADWSDRTLADRRWWMRRLETFLDAHEQNFSVDGLRLFFLALRQGTDTFAKKPLSVSSMKHAHVILNAFGNWCVGEEGGEILGRNPMRRIPAPEVKDDKIDPFGDADLRKLLDAARKSDNSLRDLAIIHFLADTGIRASELCALRVEDVDLSTCLTQVHKGKGGKSRTIAMGKSCVQAVYRYLRGEARELNDYLFASERGHPMTRSSLLKLCTRLGRVAGVPDVHPHRFRHDAAVRLLRGGANVFEVMQQLGHAQVKTLGIYVKLANADLTAMQKRASPMDGLMRASKAALPSPR